MYQREKKKEFKITQGKIRVRVLVPGKAEFSAAAVALGLAAQSWGMETLDSVEEWLIVRLNGDRLFSLIPNS